MSNINILTPIIRELEEIARSHPDPEVRANIFHVIDVLLSEDSEDGLLNIMHQFYHLREQLREEEELRKLREADPEIVAAPVPVPVHHIKEETTESLFFELFQMSDEDHFDELVEAQNQWGMPVGEA